MLALEERFMIREMYRKGISISEIARRTGRDRKTIRQVVNAPELAPAKHPRQAKACKIDPYAPYLEQRMAEGVFNARIMRDKLRKVNPRKDALCNPGHSAWHQTATTRPLTSAITALRAESEGERYTGVLPVRPSLSLFECKG